MPLPSRAGRCRPRPGRCSRRSSVARDAPGRPPQRGRPRAPRRAARRRRPRSRALASPRGAARAGLVSGGGSPAGTCDPRELERSCARPTSVRTCAPHPTLGWVPPKTLEASTRPRRRQLSCCRVSSDRALRDFRGDASSSRFQAPRPIRRASGPGCASTTSGGVSSSRAAASCAAASCSFFPKRNQRSGKV